MTDRLTLTRALEGSGMQTAAAARIATEIYDAIHDNVATKRDLRELEAKIRIVMRLGALIVIVSVVALAARTPRREHDPVAGDCARDPGARRPGQRAARAWTLLTREAQPKEGRLRLREAVNDRAQGQKRDRYHAA